jgi:hypothetical protein
LLLILFGSCEVDDPNYFSSFSISYDFSQTQHEWQGDFADYPEGDSIAYELAVSYELLPPSINKADGDRKAILLSGDNHSDDLFMFIYKQVEGLKPNTSYELMFSVTIASNAQKGSVGIGGSPGESVYLKAGATNFQPRKQLDNGYYLMNLDKGNQAVGGEDMIVLGNIGVTSTNEEYKEISKSNGSSNPFVVSTDGSGQLWFVLGTDSGFEGKTSLYYTKIRIYFNEID